MYALGQWQREALTHRWAEAPIKIARMTLTIKLDGNWSSFQLANSAPPLCVTDSAIAPSARMALSVHPHEQNSERCCTVVFGLDATLKATLGTTVGTLDTTTITTDLT